MRWEMFQETSLGAKQFAEKPKIWAENDKKRTSVAKATAYFAGFIPGMNPRPTARTSFSATCKAHPILLALSARLKPCPDTKPSVESQKFVA